MSEMYSVKNPPSDNRIVIVVWKDKANMKVLASSYRYKKNKWVGTGSGEVTWDMPDDAYWIDSPIQV